MVQYEFLGFVLPGGNWAQWFSGTASALAVVTALFGYAFNEWRHRKQNNHLEEEDAAGINFLLRRLLDEANTIYQLLSSGFQKFTLEDEEFEVDDTMGGVSFDVIEGLDKSQLRYLAFYGRMDLAQKISHATLSINQTNRSLSDYSSLVDRFYDCLRRDSNNKMGPINIDEIELQADTILVANMCTQSRSHLKQEAAKCLALAIDAASIFNDFLAEKFKSNIDFKIPL
jgi:hypothetical protein